MTELPDPRKSQAVLIGVAEYTYLAKLPGAANNVSALADALRSNHVWGLPPQNCVAVRDPANVADVLDLIVTAARDATDTLLFYFAGHGLVDPRRSELHLAIPGSDPQRIYTAVPYSQVRDVLLDSPAFRRIVILDCCYSGRALGQMGDAVTTVVDEASAEGTFILAAAAENKVALASPDAPYTAFTTELLNIINNGIPEHGPLLDLDLIYRHLLVALRSKGYPLPQKRDRNTAGQLNLIRNRAFRRQQRKPRMTRVMVDGDYIALGLHMVRKARAFRYEHEGPRFENLIEPEGPPLDTILNTIFDRLARFGQVKVYLTPSRGTLLLEDVARRFGATVFPHRLQGMAGLQQYDEAKSNTGIEMAMAIMAELPDISELILVTGDSGFIPLIAEAKRANTRVTVAYLPDRPSPELAKAADRYIKLPSPPRHPKPKV